MVITVQAQLATKLQQAVQNCNLIGVDLIPITKIKETGFGDYATNIAFLLAKTNRTNPLVLAEKIVTQLEKQSRIWTKIEIKAPGFINFFIDSTAFLPLLQAIVTQKNTYGQLPQASERYNLEMVSVNPTGYLHIGHARNAIIADTLSNIMKFRGYLVEKEYYVNDAGNQIRVLVDSVMYRYFEAEGAEISKQPAEFYAGAEITTCAEALKIKYGTIFKNKLDLSEEQRVIISQFCIDFMLDAIKQDLAAIDITLDRFFHEKTIYDQNLITAVLEKFAVHNMTYEAEGAVWLKTTLFQDDKDRVLIKKDGTYTYFLPDIAYHLVKLQRADHLINVFGADHAGYVPRLCAAIQALGYDATKVTFIIIQMVRLLKNGQEWKMSKRQGTSVTLRQLVTLIGKDALRYFMVKNSPNAHLDIDLAIAVQQNNENPVFYVQYVHARINQILAKATTAITTSVTLLTSSEEQQLLLLLDDYVNILDQVINKKQPHLLTNYLKELAKMFHTFYNQHHILTSAEPLKSQRLFLITAIKQIIKNGLALLGIEAKDIM